jgi:hypothetical protein
VGDQQGPPTCPREQTTECREDRTITGLLPHTCVKLPFENTNLVSEDQHLDVLVRLASPARHNRAEDGTQAGVEKADGHDG